MTTCDLCTRDSLGLLSANLAPPAFPALLHSDQPEEDDDVDRVGGEGNAVRLRCKVMYFQSSLRLKGDIYFEKKMKVDMSGWLMT